MTDKIILAGNPNVGKSTLFNALTGLRQHTGNWAGKTVGSAYGFLELKGRQKMIIDTPGTYSLNPSSPDEEAAMETICNEDCDLIVVVGDGCCIERSLYLALQIMEKRSNVLLCINLMDEAKKNGIEIDFKQLSADLGVPVIGISAARGFGMEQLIEAIASPSVAEHDLPSTSSQPVDLKMRAEKIALGAVRVHNNKSHVHPIDKVLSHKFFAIPIMLLLFFGILWLSISGANLPSELLSRLFSNLGHILKSCLEFIHIPQMVISMLIDGVYGTTTWVIAVMLPPMAIFFPLFTLMEDFGLLPRIAFNMDAIFKKCGSCGKQALTMCMGLGCNAVGVTGCRIISSQREKLISVLTNSFMPCNGRFPTIIMLGSLLFSGSDSSLASAAVLALIILGAILTFISSKLLALTICKGEVSSFSLELPPYRKPKILETLVRSLMDRTAKVLLRAIKASAPAGLLIWLLANITFGGNSILYFLRACLELPAAVFGLDGAILLAFILGLPANEIVMPIIMMCYMSGSSLSSIPAASEMGIILSDMGWSVTTIICLMVFTLLHWPCATTLMTIKKECGKIRYVLLAAILPTIWGLIICFIVNLVI